MKKINALLLSLLLLPFLAQAENETKEQQTNNPLLSLANFTKEALRQAQDEKETIKGISNILTKDIKATAKYADSATVLFKIKKEDNHNAETWLTIIESMVDLIKRAEHENPEDLVAELFNLLNTWKDLTGDGSGIRGEVSIKLGSPENYAKLAYTKD